MANENNEQTEIKNNTMESDAEDLMRARGAHDQLSLPLLLTNKNSCLLLLRSQQKELLSTLTEIIDSINNNEQNQSEISSETYNLLVIFSAKIALHLSIESNFVLKMLASDPKTASIFTQTERDVDYLKSNLTSFLKTYPTTSSIFSGMVQFKTELHKQKESISKHFITKNRDVYPLYERTS